MGEAAPAEVELKLLISPQDRAALEEHLALLPGVSSSQTREERTTYFDTPELCLARRGLSLRVRVAGEARVQTLKTAGAAGPASSRGEWEWPVESDVPDIALAQATPHGAEIDAAAAQGLHPVLVTEIRRTTRRVPVADGGEVEAAFDEGAIAADSRRTPVCELELELKRGPPRALYVLALDLRRTAPFTIGGESKAARGLRLRMGAKPGAVHSEPPPLDPDAPAADAVRVVVVAGLAHIVANQPAAAAGEVEGIHQIRIGIRRLRTALALFGKALEAEARRGFEAELRWWGRVFGAARDWDVFCTETLPRALAEPDLLPYAELLRPAAETERAEAHAAVARALAEPGLTPLVLRLGAWVEPDATGAIVMGNGKLGRRLGKLAPALLDRMASKAARRRRAIAAGSDTELHGLRKALKKLRYSAEYLGPLYKPKRVRPNHHAIKRLLGLLGTGNDAVVAEHLARSLPQGGDTAMGAAAAALSAWVRRDGERARHKLPKAWAAYADAPRFW